MTGYVVFAHGSSVEAANDAVRAAARAAARQGNWEQFAAAFLGGGKPDLIGAIEELAAKGAAKIIVIPYFLTSGLHLERDLPALVGEARRARPHLEIETTAPLDGHPGLVNALVDRARELCSAG
jgi:sirohydrochlorin ferrochelatase